MKKPIQSMNNGTKAEVLKLRAFYPGPTIPTLGTSFYYKALLIIEKINIIVLNIVALLSQNN
jgi:uncharacterized protein YbbC (DUF1343 family)